MAAAWPQEVSLRLVGRLGGVTAKRLAEVAAEFNCRPRMSLHGPSRQLCSHLTPPHLTSRQAEVRSRLHHVVLQR